MCLEFAKLGPKFSGAEIYYIGIKSQKCKDFYYNTTGLLQSVANIWFQYFCLHWRGIYIKLFMSEEMLSKVYWNGILVV